MRANRENAANPPPPPQSGFALQRCDDCGHLWRGLRAACTSCGSNVIGNEHWFDSATVHSTARVGDEILVVLDVAGQLVVAVADGVAPRTGETVESTEDESGLVHVWSSRGSAT